MSGDEGFKELVMFPWAGFAEASRTFTAE